MVDGLRASSPRKMSDQIYLCAHDLRGRSRLTPRALQLGVGTAVLGDCVVDGYLEVVDGRFRLRERGWKRLGYPRPNGRPTVVRWVMEQIHGSPTTELRDWITHIASFAPELIAHRLEADGVVRRTEPGRFVFWRTSPRYVPVDLNSPNHLGDHLWMALRGRSSLTVVDVFLAGLLQATQLHRTVITELPYLDGLIDRQVRALTESTDAGCRARDTSLSALLAHTRHLITTAALAQTL